jgi:hypothetical protein
MANNRGAQGSPDGASFQRFNLETMSGVFPGTRTARFQRIRLEAVQGHDVPNGWSRVLWYDDPISCVVMTPATEAAEQPLVRLTEPTADLHRHLQDALEASGYRPRICGACSHWRITQGETEEGLPLGRCAFRAADHTLPPTVESLTLQSGLALDCSHFMRRGEPEAAPPSEAAAGAEEATAGAEEATAGAEEATAGAEEATAGAEEAAAVTLSRAAEVRKSQEAARDSLKGRIRRLLGGTKPSTPSWTEQLLERSGVGAGTEPCFACQGRIANLGALTVASPEGDKQTYSIWRCRQCFTTYLNRWIDRWERLDSLETDETYWRIAPAEAVALLAIMAGVAGGDHPEGRHQRIAERERFEVFVRDRPALSHQIKLGR